MVETDIPIRPGDGHGPANIAHLRDAMLAAGLTCHLKRYDNAPQIPWLIFDKEFVAVRFEAVGDQATSGKLEIALEDWTAPGLLEVLDVIEGIFRQFGWQVSA